MPKKLQRKPIARKPAKATPATAAGSTGQLAPAEKSTGGGLLQSRRVTTALLTEFTSQLAVLLDAGIPVTKCLRILEGQMRPGALKRALGGIVDDVESGTSLSEALAKYPPIFDSLYTNMVAAGEAGGVQDVILNRLAGFMENQEEIRSRVKGALAYPIAIMTVAAAVMVLVFIFVIPKFKEIFVQQFGSLDEMPVLTQYVIGASEHLQAWWWTYVLGVFLIYALHRLLCAKWPTYLRTWHTFLLRIPLFGTLMKKSLVARFTRTFGTLIESGVPHLQALDILRGSVGNVRMIESVTRVHASIREGSGIADPMGKSGIFDDIVVNMVDVGEQTGELDRMLGKIADRYEIEVKRTVDSTFKFIEPMLLVVMAVMVGVIVFALFLPLLKLLQKF